MKQMKSQNQLLIIYLAVGFFLGILYENIILKLKWIDEEILLQSEIQIVSETYLLKIICLRIAPIVGLYILCNTVWRKLFIVLGLLWVGFLIGVMAVMSVMRFGIRGVIFCLISLLPHMLFYFLAYGVMISYFYRYPERQWNSSKTLFVVLTFFIGLTLEVYLTPVLLRMFLF